MKEKDLTEGNTVSHIPLTTLTQAERRSEIARHAANARWGNKGSPKLKAKPISVSSVSCPKVKSSKKERLTPHESNLIKSPTPFDMNAVEIFDQGISGVERGKVIKSAVKGRPNSSRDVHQEVLIRQELKTSTLLSKYQNSPLGITNMWFESIWTK